VNTDSRRNRSDQLRIKHLRLLELVAEHHSLAAVAQALHLSQPTVTSMVQTLEEVFGTTLIERSARGGSLTDAGSLALRQLRIALASFDTALESVVLGSTPLVRVGVLPLLDAWLLPQAMARMEATGTLPRIAITHGGINVLYGGLDRSEIDCAICHLDELPVQGGHLTDLHKGGHLTDLHIEPLHEESRLFACATAHPLAQHASLRLGDLANQEWIVPPKASQARRVLERVFLGAGLVPPEPRVESFPYHTNLEVVAATRMLTFAPSSPVRHYAEMGRVHILPIADDIPVSRLAFLARQPVMQLPGVEPLRQAVVWAARQMAGRTT